MLQKLGAGTTARPRPIRCLAEPIEQYGVLFELLLVTCGDKSPLNRAKNPLGNL